MKEETQTEESQRHLTQDAEEIQEDSTDLVTTIKKNTQEVLRKNEVILPDVIYL